MKKFTLLLLLLPFFSFKRTNNNVDVFFGDSITFGNELYQFQYTQRWSKQYTVAINTDEYNFGKSGASMITNAWPGRPSFDITEVPGYGPSCRNIFVSYWVNDYLYGKTSSQFAAATAAAVDGIIAKGWPANKIVLCFNYMPESPGSWVDMTHAKATEWLNALRSVQQAKGTSFLDFYTAVYNRSDKASYSGDLIHPTAAWNAIMKDMALTNIESPVNTLPATIINFSGQRQGTTNNIKWTVAQEQNVLQYEIEKSENGALWTRAGTIASLGNTSVQRTYNFADNASTSGKQLYRLKTIDRNGAVKVSSVIIITGSKPTVTSLTSLYPNPASTDLTVLVDAPGKETIIFHVTDVMGRLVKTQKETVESGTNNFKIQTANLQPGNYVLKAMNDTNEVCGVIKFIKR